VPSRQSSRPLRGTTGAACNVLNEQPARVLRLPPWRAGRKAPCRRECRRGDRRRPCPRPPKADALPPERYNLSPRLRRGLLLCRSSRAPTRQNSSVADHWQVCSASDPPAGTTLTSKLDLIAGSLRNLPK
jgi:hypothetical protein